MSCEEMPPRSMRHWSRPLVRRLQRILVTLLEDGGKARLIQLQQLAAAD